MGREAMAGPPKMMFGNTSLAVHILRGLIGLAAFGLAFGGYYTIGWPAFLILPLAPLMMKGCPTCWLTGLFETIAYRRWQRDVRKKGIVSGRPGVSSAGAEEIPGRTHHA